MHAYLKELHLRAGEAAGRDRTCGVKIDYKDEKSAIHAAEKMSVKYSKNLEAYPCFFCGGWHIGRRMGIEELESHSR